MSEEDAIESACRDLGILCGSGDWIAADQHIAGIDVGTMPVSALLSVLTLTAIPAVRVNLTARHRFWRLVRQRLHRERGDEETNELLSGLD